LIVGDRAKSRNAARKAPVHENGWYAERIKRRRINAGVIALLSEKARCPWCEYLRLRTTGDYPRQSQNFVLRIVVEAWIIRWPRHELASDIFARTAVSGFIGSSGRPSGHGNKMTKWQDNGTPRAKRALFSAAGTFTGTFVQNCARFGDRSSTRTNCTCIVPLNQSARNRTRSNMLVSITNRLKSTRRNEGNDRACAAHFATSEVARSHRDRAAKLTRPRNMYVYAPLSYLLIEVDLKEPRKRGEGISMRERERERERATPHAVSRQHRGYCCACMRQRTCTKQRGERRTYDPPPQAAVIYIGSDLPILCITRARKS